MCDTTVTIDYEDREQVGRLSRAYLAAVLDNMPADNPTHMQAALREFADPKPPKPDEPTGLGAVIEDVHGRLWIRTADVDCVKPWSLANSFEDCDWCAIDAARVLSEGWSE